MNPLKAALAYFAYVFGAGFLLGSVRVPLLVPRFGERVAELVEMPIMFGVILYSARWIVRRFHLAPAPSVRLRVGGIALGLLLLAELSLMSWLQGISLSQYLGQRDPVSGSVYAFLLLVFAAMPLLVRRMSSE